MNIREELRELLAAYKAAGEDYKGLNDYTIRRSELEIAAVSALPRLLDAIDKAEEALKLALLPDEVIESLRPDWGNTNVAVYKECHAQARASLTAIHQLTGEK